MTDSSALTVGDVLAERLRSIRKARGWSVDQLADECASWGASELTAPSLTNMERQGVKRTRRRVTLDEWLVLAAVLRVNPMALLVPPHAADVRITSDVQMPVDVLLQWVRSTTPQPLPADTIPPMDPNDNVTLRASGTLRLLDAHRSLITLILKYQAEGDEDHVRQYVATLHTYRRHIRERGEVPPALPAEVIELVGDDDPRDVDAGSVTYALTTVEATVISPSPPADLGGLNG